VAFLGSSAASVAATAQALREATGFRGRGHTSLAQLLLDERVDAVSVCTPPALHARHVFNALEAGCAVLCEKPLVWDPASSSVEMLEEAERLIEEAERNSVLLSVNTQYVAAVEAYRQLVPQAPGTPKQFYAEMASKRRPNDPGGQGLWLDLMPHPLSILLALLPDAVLWPATVRATIEEWSSRVEFEFEANGRRCHAEIRLAKTADPPFPRRFGLDGAIAEVGTQPDEKGTYHGFVRVGDRVQTCADFMETSIARFCAAVQGQGRPLVEPPDAVRNLELMLTVLDEAKRPPRRL
jgi:predicted dehydrogenase